MLKKTFKIASLILMILAFIGPAWAGNKLLNVQGKIASSTGSPLSGTYTITFRLYANSNDPIASSTWTESQSVVVSTGLYNVALGSVNTLDLLPFNKPYYLGIQVAGDPNELSPRQLLGASAYALGSLGSFNVKGNLIDDSGVVINGPQQSSNCNGGAGIANQNYEESCYDTNGHEAQYACYNPSANAFCQVAIAGTSTRIYNGSGITYATFLPAAGGGTQLTGTTAGDNAAAGNDGEYVFSTIGGVNAPPSGAYGDLTSITLTAGDWDVTGIVWWQAPGANWSQAAGGISTTPGNSGAGLNLGDNFLSSSSNNTLTQTSVTISNYRMSLSVAKPVYLKIWAGYSSGMPQAWGRISARRVR
jgi:hypothetical protein